MRKIAKNQLKIPLSSGAMYLAASVIIKDAKTDGEAIKILNNWISGDTVERIIINDKYMTFEECWIEGLFHLDWIETKLSVGDVDFDD